MQRPARICRDCHSERPVGSLQTSRTDICAYLQQVTSKSRQQFFKDVAPGGEYDGTVGIFHEHLGGKAAVGELDEEFITGLPDSCKFIAHRGAGYDSIAVKTAKQRGRFTPG